MTVLCEWALESVCTGVSAIEIEICFVGKFVYRAQRSVLMTFYREAMQDFEASDEIGRGLR